MDEEQKSKYLSEQDCQVATEQPVTGRAIPAQYSD